MKKIHKILLFIPLLFLSCASPYLKSYDPINEFLKTQKKEQNTKYILQSDKESNKQALRIFNGDRGPEHIYDPTDPIDRTSGLFVEREWKKMYAQYANDTIKKYWKKEDFPENDFILEKGEGLTRIEKYYNSLDYKIISISEPIYYSNKKYIMFYYCEANFIGYSNSHVISSFR